MPVSVIVIKTEAVSLCEVLKTAVVHGKFHTRLHSVRPLSSICFSSHHSPGIAVISISFCR